MVYFASGIHINTLQKLEVSSYLLRRKCLYWHDMTKVKGLLVAATETEIEPFLKAVQQGQVPALLDVLVTGVGMVATAFSLGKAFQQQSYDFALNVGICGAISREIALGEMVFIVRDVLYELGAEDDEDFISIVQLGFGENTYSAIPGVAAHWSGGLKQVEGITVNRVHGNTQTINRLQQRTSAVVESMEGAAFYYACKQAGIPSMQVRSVSNYVEKRDKSKWKIGLAIKQLNDWLVAKSEQLGSESG